MGGAHDSDKISSITIKNFAKFNKMRLDFKDINVIVGENGAGKSYLLKLLYSAMAATHEPDGRQTGDQKMNRAARHTPRTRPSMNKLESRLAKKLVGVHRPEQKKVGRLVRRQQGQLHCDIDVQMEDERKSIEFSFATNSSTKVTIDRCPTAWCEGTPVFLPTHELLSIYPGFAWLYEQYHLEFDETWYDTCRLLGAPQLRGRRGADIDEMSKPLHDHLGGNVILKDDRFYLRGDEGTLEMSLVAEGLRKVGMLWYLITTKQMEGVHCLFWDEPDANLNPRIINAVVKAISLISKHTQVFVATHSVFLVKAFGILQRRGELPSSIRYFALKREDDAVNAKFGDEIYDLEPWVALDETNDQSLTFIDEFGK